ncbi:hypothetical protein DFP73DRAFT_309976 [Morchella snyderi]|nr:hypothetical protein DFP73DRAFT_309976 [Morchella snyderi]
MRLHVRFGGPLAALTWVQAHPRLLCPPTPDRPPNPPPFPSIHSVIFKPSTTHSKTTPPPRLPCGHCLGLLLFSIRVRAFNIRVRTFNRVTRTSHSNIYSLIYTTQKTLRI